MNVWFCPAFVSMLAFLDLDEGVISSDFFGEFDELAIGASGLLGAVVGVDISDVAG